MATPTKTKPVTLSSKKLKVNEVVQKVTLFIKGDSKSIEYVTNSLPYTADDYGVEYIGKVEVASIDDFNNAVEVA